MDFLLIVAVLAAAVWAVAVVLRASPLVGALLFIALTVAFGYEFLHIETGAVVLTLDRLWMLVLLAMFCVQWKLGRMDIKPLAWVDVVLLTFLALLTASTLLTTRSATPSRLGGPPTWHLMVGYLFPAVLYFVARQSPLTEKRLRFVYAFLALLGVYLSVTAIAEMTHQWWLVFPTYIADPKIGLHFGRARGPMVQSVSLGLYLGICTVAAVAWLQCQRRGVKSMIVLAIPLGLIAAALTLTRSVWMGTALAMLICAALVLSGWRRKAVLFGSLAVVAVMVTLNADRLTSFEREGTAEDTRSSAASRASFAYVSWKMFQDHPILGFGFGEFPEAKLPYLSDRNTSLNLELIRPLIHHNTYLNVLVELGLVGFILFVTLLALWVYYGWRLWRSTRRPLWARLQGLLLLCSLATYAVQMMFHEVSFTSVDNSVIYLLAGITVGLSYGGGESRRTDRGRKIDASLNQPASPQPALAFG
jgi:O-antigen ligase